MTVFSTCRARISRRSSPSSRRLLLVLAAAVTLLAVSATSLPAAVAQQAELDQVRQQLDEIEDDITRSSAEIADAQANVAAARTRADRLVRLTSDAQQKADEATERYGRIHADVHLLNDRADQLADDIAAAESDMLGLEDQVTELAVSRYIYAGQGLSLFDSEDVAQQIFIDALAEFISQGNQDVLEDFRLALDDLNIRKENLTALREQVNQREAEAEAAAASLNETFAELNTLRQELDADLQIIAAELGRVQSVRANLEARLASLESEETRIELEIRKAEVEAKLQAELAAARAAEAAAAAQAQSSSSGSSTVYYTGEITVRSGPDWICPVAGPFTHYKDWRAPRAYGGWHKGNDLFAPRGTPLVSTESGRVEHFYNRVGGNSVRIYADSGNYYYYTHLDSYANVAEGGQWLEAGTVVGYMGNTGNAATTPVHLHFEFHLAGRGNYVNPYPYIRANCF